MLNIITFKGKYNRKLFIKLSEELRRRKIFHRARLINDNLCSIHYTDNIRGWELLEKEV